MIMRQENKQWKRDTCMMPENCKAVTQEKRNTNPEFYQELYFFFYDFYKSESEEKQNEILLILFLMI